jgi:hypothetical protein
MSFLRRCRAGPRAVDEILGRKALREGSYRHYLQAFAFLQSKIHHMGPPLVTFGVQEIPNVLADTLPGETNEEFCRALLERVEAPDELEMQWRQLVSDLKMVDDQFRAWEGWKQTRIKEFRALLRESFTTQYEELNEYKKFASLPLPAKRKVVEEENEKEKSTESAVVDIEQEVVVSDGVQDCNAPEEADGLYYN